MVRAKSQKEFLEQAGLNNYVEYSLDGEDAVLIYDVLENPSMFLPHISTSEKYGEDDVQEVDDLLNSENMINYRSVEYDETNSKNRDGSIFHVEGAELP
jgi:hypothetical protein